MTTTWKEKKNKKEEMTGRSFVPLAEQLEDQEALNSLSTQEKVKMYIYCTKQNHTH